MDHVINMSAFVQVVNAGSFVGAARRLDISPASVTSRVQSLEQRFGVRLLNRTTRRVSLTEEGEAFYQRCNRILAEIADVESLASALQAKPNGTLRLNADATLTRLVAPLVGEYTALYPDVSCELILTEKMADIVEEKFDLAIFAGPLRDSALVGRSLGVAPAVICAAPAYLMRHGSPQHPKDLMTQNCLDLVNGAAGNQWRFIGTDGEHVIAVTGNLRSNSIEGLRAGALAGQGICLVPLASVAEDIGRGSLVRLLSAYEIAAPVVQAVYPPGRHLSTKVRTFLDFLIKRLRKVEPMEWNTIKEKTRATRAGAVETTRRQSASSPFSSAQQGRPSCRGTIAKLGADREPVRMTA